MFWCFFFTIWLFEITLANFISESILLLDPELWNSGLQMAGTCKAMVNGLQNQTVHRAFWLRVWWWKGMVIWEEPELTDKNMRQQFSHYIEANIFLFCFSWAKNVCAVSSSDLVVFDNLLWNSKWVTCLTISADF